MKERYNEILRLKGMLERAKIPFKFSELMGGYHIVYPTDGGECICSVIEHDSSYGREKDLLEIQGLLTELEEETLEGNVLGYLTAEDVFQRIKNHWEKKMSLNKAILHGKEHRKPYRRSKRFDKTCRNHGSCPYCRDNRLHNRYKTDEDTRLKIEEAEE